MLMIINWRYVCIFTILDLLKAEDIYFLIFPLANQPQLEHLSLLIYIYI